MFSLGPLAVVERVPSPCRSGHQLSPMSCAVREPLVVSNEQNILLRFLRRVMASTATYTNDPSNSNPFQPKRIGEAGVLAHSYAPICCIRVWVVDWSADRHGKIQDARRLASNLDPNKCSALIVPILKGNKSKTVVHTVM